MLKSGSTILGPILLNFFNAILKIEQAPKAWGSGYIVPIFKSGAKSEPDNYRPITITSCLGKLFTLLLNNRLNEFISKYDKLNEFQIGFKKKCRTSDHILLLKTIIDLYKKKKKHIYACFVDFSSAFPSVWRVGLFYKLYETGLSSKFVNIIQNLYSNTKCQVKVDNRLSETFTTSFGTKQGCNLSPTLFNLFTNDLPKVLLKSNMMPVKIMDKLIPLLMYADDIVILSETASGLQSALDALSTYCNCWKLSINIKKTKIIIFNARVSVNKVFKINSNTVDIVTSYTYLGIVFTPSGKFTKAIDMLRIKATKAWNYLHRSFNIWNGTPVKVLLKLFSSLVQPIMLYGSEVWGAYLYRSFENISAQSVLYNPKFKFESIHISICKQILGLNKKSSNIAVLGELGRYPVMLNVIKSYYSYLIRNQNMAKGSLVKLAMQCQKELNSSLMNFFGLSKFFNNVLKYKLPNVKMHTKNKIAAESTKVFQKLQDFFKKQFPKIIQENKKLSIYYSIKKQFRYEPYLSFVKNIKCRIALSKIRTSSHNLPIETGRYQNINRNERLCNMCDLNEIGSELHVLFICSNNDLKAKREKLFNKIQSFIPQFSNLSLDNKLLYMLSCCDKDLTLNIGEFLTECLTLYKI